MLATYCFCLLLSASLAASFLLVPDVVPPLFVGRPLYGATSSTEQDHPDDEDASIDEHLISVAQKLRFSRHPHLGLRIESNDQSYGLQVIRTNVTVTADAGIGLVLEELMTSPTGGDGGLVLLRQVNGKAAQADPNPLLPGDMITRVSVVRDDVSLFSESTAALNYDRTIEILGHAKQIIIADDESTSSGGVLLNLEINRLVERAKIRLVVMEDGDKKSKKFDVLAGENLRGFLMRKEIAVLGLCGGQGQCGQCIVELQQQHDSAPIRQRACETIIGADNQPGTLIVKL